MTASTIPLRAALYLRVSTARQAEHDVSIPDQKRQGEAYCASRGYQLVETYVEPDASATNDHRPEFQRMIEAGTSKPAPFDVVVVHSFKEILDRGHGKPGQSPAVEDRGSTLAELIAGAGQSR
jgi:DNA invertase Pin-like site-specific DNA recombinase